MTSIRPYREQDLGRVVGLWEDLDLTTGAPDGLTVDEAFELMADEATAVLVAERHGEVVGVGIGSVVGPVGTIHRLSGDAEALERLLDDLESCLAERGARKLVARADTGQSHADSLLSRGFELAKDTEVYERVVPGTTAGPDAVAALGGQMVPSGLWDELKGMEVAKGLIERRVILPLEQPSLAARHGVDTPHAIMLFGPPGTGKTTFAKGVASRLSWPFVPVEPAQLSEEGSEHEARELARTFDRLLELPSAVAFVDEVEEIAAARGDERRVATSVTTEFLRQIPRMRERPNHLLVCATNHIGALDPAFLRPGRFDHLLPVGPPDEPAREAIWRRYTTAITDQDIDIDELVRVSDRFTAADIEFAARKAAQMAFEREYEGHASDRAGTNDFLDAIDQTPPTLTPEMIEDFEEDMQRFARL